MCTDFEERNGERKMAFSPLFIRFRGNNNNYNNFTNEAQNRLYLDLLAYYYLYRMQFVCLHLICIRSNYLDNLLAIYTLHNIIITSVKHI